MRAIVRRLLMLWSSARLKGRVRLAVAPGSRVDLRRIDAQDDCHVAVGPNSLISARISFDRSGATFRCGARCYIGASHMVVAQAIEMGDDVVISWGVTIVDHNSHAVDWDHRARDVLDWADNRKNWDHVKVAPVRLQDKVWVGFNAIILKGVTVGEGAVVAAGAVVSRDVPPYSVVAGNPARVVRDLKAGT